MIRSFGKTISAFLFVCALLLCCVVCAGGTSVAFADNLGEIGTEDIPTMKEVDAAEYVSSGEGVTFEITCSLATEKLIYKFDADRTETEGLPDILPPKGEVELKKVGTKLKGSLKTLYNGEIILYAYIRKGADEVVEVPSIPYVVNKIDWSSPVLDPNRESMSTAENGTLQYTIYVYDNVKAHTEYTAASGLKEVTVFYWDEKSTVKPEDEDISDSDELIEKYGDIMGIAKTVRYPVDKKAVQYDYITFDVARSNVAYYVLTIDRVGNVGLSRLFYREAQTRYPITVDGVQIDCSELISIAERESVEGKGEYNADLLNNLSLAAYRLRITFLREGYSEADRKEAWRELRNLQQQYANAKREVTVEMKNADLLGGKAEIVGTVDSIKKAALKGDSLVVELMWVKYSPAAIKFSALENAVGVKSPEAYWKLEYALKWNGQEVAPDSPLIVHVEWSDTYKEIGFAQQIGTEIKAKTGEGAGNWAEFRLDTASETVWIAVRTSVDLTPLWITLGVVGGAGIAVTAILMILKKKGIAVFKKKTEGKSLQTKQEGEDGKEK